LRISLYIFQPKNDRVKSSTLHFSSQAHIFCVSTFRVNFGSTLKNHADKEKLFGGQVKDMKKKSSYDSILSYNKVFKPAFYYSDINTK